LETNIQQPKDKWIAGLISTAIVFLLLLFLFLYRIITPNPPFEFSGEEGMEMNFGTYNEGTGEIENDGIGDVTSVVAQSESAPSQTSPSTEKIEEAFENGEAVLENNDKPKIQNNTTLITTVKQQTNENTSTNPSTPTNTNSSLLNNFLKNGNKKGGSGGDGNSGQAGNDGVPDGNPNTNGLGGHGNNPNHIGNGGGGKGGIQLSGRKILNPPCPVNDSKEEGVVVVIITVNKDGKVIEADPNGRGTNTSSSVLKSKARQAALCAVFSSSANGQDEQTGSVTFKFEF
jgi:hypothetical protein